MGTDFGAPTGTAVRTVGDGVVEFAGTQNGYGNLVTIKHWNNYSTAYAHMSRFAPGIRRGTPVKQGDVIGYVGSTGLSSGPHLHFEVLVNSRFVDPMSIQVPRERKLEGKDLGIFMKKLKDTFWFSPDIVVYSESEQIRDRIIEIFEQGT